MHLCPFSFPQCVRFWSKTVAMTMIRTIFNMRLPGSTDGVGSWMCGLLVRLSLTGTAVGAMQSVSARDSLWQSTLCGIRISRRRNTSAEVSIRLLPTAIPDPWIVLQHNNIVLCHIMVIGFNLFQEQRSLEKVFILSTLYGILSGYA